MCAAPPTGVAVVHHDAHLADGRRIGRLHADELPSYVPSLAEGVEACEDLSVQIEIKNLPDDPDYDSENLVAAAVAGLIAAYLGPDRALVSSFNVDAVNAVRNVDPSVRTALICGIVAPIRRSPVPVPTTWRRFHPFDAMCDSAFVRRAHEAGLAVNVWTINDAERMAGLLSIGVDGIVTDVPDVARRVIDSNATR